MTGAPARLVIRTPNWLGDAVMALPAMGAVRRTFSGSTITVAAPAGIAPLFEEITPAAQDAIVVVPRRREAAVLREAQVDAALLLPNSFGAALTAWRAGIRERWGYAAGGRGLLLTRRAPRPAGTVHQTAYYASLVAALGCGDPAGELPRMTVRPETAARAAARLAREGVAPEAPLVGFAPGAAYGHAKRWPPQRVAEVIARLSRERGAVAVLFGAAGDRDAGREIESSVPGGTRLVNLIGRTDLRLLAGLIARCHGFVSNDSGAMHLAAALGVPVVAIFGPTNDRATSPAGTHDVLVHQVFCRPCMLRDCPIDHRCMKGITPAAVHDAVASRLDARGARA